MHTLPHATLRRYTLARPTAGHLNGCARASGSQQQAPCFSCGSDENRRHRRGSTFFISSCVIDHPSALMLASEGARIDELRARTLSRGAVLSTDELRDRLALHGDDVRKAADAIVAQKAKQAPSTPPGSRTPAKPALIVPEFDLTVEAPAPDPRPAAPVVRVGIGVAVVRPSDGKLLVGERLGSHGADKVAFPGGHLEMTESWDECARREVWEETGLQVEAPCTHVATTNDVMAADGKTLAPHVLIFKLARDELLSPRDPTNAAAGVRVKTIECAPLPRPG